MHSTTHGARQSVSHRWAFRPGIHFNADVAGGGASSGDGAPAGDGTGGAGDGTAKTFTQEQFDRALETRLQRERDKIASPDKAVISKTYYEELRAKSEQFDQLQEAQKTETQKAIDRAEAAENAARAATERVKETALRASVISAAARKDVVDPDAALALLDRSALTWEENTSDWGNIDQALDALLTAKPYLVKPSGGTRPTGSADQGARGSAAGSQLTREALSSMSPEDIRKARQDGRLDALLNR